MTEHRMSVEQRARLLHAKAGELENAVLNNAVINLKDITADLALLFALMAEHVEEGIQEALTDYQRHSTHTDALDTLGNLIGPDEKRDAIHLAVEPVVAGDRLLPGEHVSLEDGVAHACAVGAGVGIVDPFINGMVGKGDMFWLIVYPRQIASLRHVWEHPDFPPSSDLAPAVASRHDKAEAEKWLRDWHRETDVPWGFEETVRQIENADDEYVFVGGEDASGSIPDEWYTHYEIWRGYEFHGKRAGWFSCSC